MADQEENPAKNELDASPKNTSSPIGENAVAAGSQEKDSRRKCDEQPGKTEIIVNVPPSDNNEANEIAREANTIAKNEIRWTKWGFFVNGILVICTFVALFLTNQSVNISAKALTDARDRAFQDSIDRKKDRHDDSVNTAKRFSLDSTGLAAQIQSLKDAGQRFRDESRPVVQIANIKLDTTTGDVKFDVINMGKFPAIVVYDKTGGLIDKEKAPAEVLGSAKLEYLSRSSYVPVSSNNTRAPRTFGGYGFSPLGLKEFKEGRIFYYLVVKLHYINLISKDKYVFECIYRIGWVHGGFDVASIMMTDTPVSKF